MRPTRAARPAPLRGVAATFLGRVLDVDHGLLHTVHWLTVRPDRVVRDYLAGRTVPYTNPVAYLLLCFAAFAIAVRVFGGTTASEDYWVLTASPYPSLPPCLACCSGARA